MAFKLGSVTLAEVPAGGDASTGSYLMSDGAGASFWAYMGATGANTSIDTTSWEYRSIYTHGYLAAGYKGSNPWRSVNQTWHATEVTMYCGEQIAYTQGYTNGCWSDHNAYIIAGAGFNVATAIICSYSLTNGTIRTFTAGSFQSGTAPYGYQGHDPKNEGILYGTAGSQGVGGMSMEVTRLDPPATNDVKGQHGYMTGGGSSIAKLVPTLLYQNLKSIRQVVQQYLLSIKCVLTVNLTMKMAKIMDMLWVIMMASKTTTPLDKVILLTLK